VVKERGLYFETDGISVGVIRKFFVWIFFLFHTQTFLCVEKYFLDQKYFGGLGFFKKSNLDSLIFKLSKFQTYKSVYHPLVTIPHEAVTPYEFINI